MSLQDAEGAVTSVPLPPQPILGAETEFFWRGLQEGRLLIQRCTACATLRHPPAAVCVQCHSLDWDSVASCGRGQLVAMTVVHQPRLPGFNYPLPVGVIALEEGTRIVAPLAGIDPVAAQIGMRLRASILPRQDGYFMPYFVKDSTSQGDEHSHDPRAAQ